MTTPRWHLWRRATVAQIVPLGRGRTIPTKRRRFVLLTLTEPQVFEKSAENTQAS
jgi:hypothetical protein